MQGADDKRETDEGERDENADLRVSGLDAQRVEKLPQPAVACVKRGQRDAGHRSRQGKGQINQRIENPPARKPVAREDPGHDKAEDGIGRRREERDAEGDLVGRHHLASGHGGPKFLPPHAGGTDEDRGQRNEHEQREVSHGDAHGQTKARQDAP